MPSRRETLLAGGPLLSSTFAGCPDTFRIIGSLQEVHVELHNEDNETHTFHLALERESEIALHGAVDGFADDVEFIEVDDVDGDFCLRVTFWYQHGNGELTELAKSADTRC